ncbi:hypothetical protein ILUMI_03581 [Ignelater luminosus]|uniref:Uncharacterized protein n=1 Tax=Ignelater luminosus TaxID=2038154 RepID=A0A8K0DAQ5_IGNLU|nr:hypothetical protein ILUMI_03581 [Ignelater luminosus]
MDSATNNSAGASSEMNSPNDNSAVSNEVNLASGAVSDTNETNKSVEMNNAEDSRNNAIIEMHVEGTGGSNNQCSYCCARLANDCNENSKTVEVESKRSVDYFCGMDTPPSDRTAEENSPTTMEISLENNSSTKLYSYVPDTSEEELYIDTDYENQGLQISETTPNDSQNATETETETPNSSSMHNVQEEENLNVVESLCTETLDIQEPCAEAIDTQEPCADTLDDTQESLNEIEINIERSETINESNETQEELNVTQIEDTEREVDDFETAETVVEETPTEIPLEEPADENESNEISVEVSDKPAADETEIESQIDVEESFDDNLDQTPLSIDEEEETGEIVYTKSTAKQIIEMVKEIELQEKEVPVSPVSEVSVIVNAPENELNQQRPEFQQHIYMPNANSPEYQMIVSQACTLNENRNTRVTDASEEYQIVKSVRESCAALHQSNYCLNSNNVAPLVVTTKSQSLEMGRGIDIIPLVLNNNLMADRQEVVYPNMNAKDNSTKIALSTTPVVEIHNKYIYTPSPVSTHLRTSTPSTLNPIMNNTLSDFENFHQKHNSLLMDPNAANRTQSHKIQASVTMQPLVESSKKTNGILKTSKRGVSHNRILYTEDGRSRSFPSDWFEKFQQSKREFIESASGPVNSLINNKSNYLNYEDSNVNDNFSLYGNVPLNNTRERCSPVSPAYEQIQANEYKNHILKVSMENASLKSENILQKKLSKRSPNQMYNIEHANNTVMQSTKNGLNNSRVNEPVMPYKSAIASKGGLKRQRNSNEPSKKPKITFNRHVETHLLPREEDFLIMPNYIKDPGISKSVNKARVRKYPPVVVGESVNKINIVTSESMEEYNVSSNDRRLFTDVPCVEVKLDTNSEIRQKIDQQTLKSKLDSVMKRKKLESENTCIQSRIDYIKSDDSAVLNRHMENVTPPYPYFGYPGMNFLGYSASSLPSGYTTPALSVNRGLIRNQLNKESTEDSRNNNTDSHLTVKTRRRSISEGKEVNVVNSHFSKKTRRRNNTTKVPIVETTKRRAGRPKKTETAKSPTSKTSTGVLYSDGPFRLG